MNSSDTLKSRTNPRLLKMGTRISSVERGEDGAADDKPPLPPKPLTLSYRSSGFRNTKFYRSLPKKWCKRETTPDFHLRKMSHSKCFCCEHCFAKGYRVVAAAVWRRIKTHTGSKLLRCQKRNNMIKVERKQHKKKYFFQNYNFYFVFKILFNFFPSF